jgi:hypothetical protein
MDDNQWCQHDIMSVVIMQLHSSSKWGFFYKVAIELQGVAFYIQWIVILQFM